jgi:hypothetical protein
MLLRTPWPRVKGTLASINNQSPTTIRYLHVVELTLNNNNNNNNKAKNTKMFK